MYYSIPQSVSEFQHGLIATLRDALPTFEVVATDYLRLSELSRTNNCA